MIEQNNFNRTEVFFLFPRYFLQTRYNVYDGHNYIILCNSKAIGIYVDITISKVFSRSE